MGNNYHQSVMFEEAIEGLNIKPNGIYIDATFGRGGHTLGILAKLGQTGKIIAFDRDIKAIEYAQKNLQDKRLQLVHSAFADMEENLNQRGLKGEIDGILMDLGISSPQLAEAERGFSFSADGALDMRMDTSRGISAAEWLKTADEAQIADVIYQFGEEKKSRQIARAIKIHIQKNPLTTTLQLANIIASIVKPRQGKHPATRSFQAIRIFINDEIGQLKSGLEQSIALLNHKARLVVISFHSIEDRMVKQFMRKYAQPKPSPKGLIIMNRTVEQMPLKELGKKKPKAEEILRNPRSRSAILRLAERT